MTSEITIRVATEADRDFIFSLAPRLAEVAKLHWHTDEAVLEMHDDYTSKMLAPTERPNQTLIAEKDGVPLGFIHMRTREDEVSCELSATVPLLAVSAEAQGTGAGKRLLEAAESWAKEQGFRLLHLEVFASNKHARGFYKNFGFEEESLNLIKPL